MTPSKDPASPRERELKALQLLAAELRESQQALARWDLDGLVRHTSSAQELYTEVAAARACAGASNPDLNQKLAAARQQLLQLIRVHNTVLRKSDKTVRALLNIIERPVAYGADRRPTEPAPQGGIRCRA